MDKIFIIITSAVFLAVAFFLAILLDQSIEMALTARAETEALRADLIEKEHQLSGSEYQRAELAKKTNAKFTSLEIELAETHKLYQDTIIEMDETRGDEMSRREGMIKAIYAGCLVRVPDPFQCGKAAATAYQKEIWNRIDNDALGWKELWALMRGTIRS